MILHLSHSTLGLFLHVTHHVLNLLLSLARIHALWTTPFLHFPTIQFRLFIMLAEHLLNSFGRFVKSSRMQMLDCLHRVFSACLIVTHFLPLPAAQVLSGRTQPTLEMLCLVMFSGLMKPFNLALRHFEFTASTALAHFRVESAHLLHQLV